MTEKKKGRVTYKGPIPADDPFYTNAGWNFLLDGNQKPAAKLSSVKFATAEEWEKLTGEPAGSVYISFPPPRKPKQQN